jgi:hypothetical protein
LVIVTTFLVGELGSPFCVETVQTSNLPMRVAKIGSRMSGICFGIGIFAQVLEFVTGTYIEDKMPIVLNSNRAITIYFDVRAGTTLQLKQKSNPYLQFLWCGRTTIHPLCSHVGMLTEYLS